MVWQALFRELGLSPMGPDRGIHTCSEPEFLFVFAFVFKYVTQNYKCGQHACGASAKAKVSEVGAR